MKQVFPGRFFNKYILSFSYCYFFKSSFSLCAPYIYFHPPSPVFLVCCEVSTSVSCVSLSHNFLFYFGNHFFSCVLHFVFAFVDTFRFHC